MNVETALSCIISSLPSVLKELWVRRTLWESQKTIPEPLDIKNFVARNIPANSVCVAQAQLCTFWRRRAVTAELRKMTFLKYVNMVSKLSFNPTGTQAENENSLNFSHIERVIRLPCLFDERKTFRLGITSR